MIFKGILWSGRGWLKRAFLFLLSAKNFYHLLKINAESLIGVNEKSLESLYTHNLFYLAQAYGHAKQIKLSCIYCQETLRRQFIDGFVSPFQAYEWCKNGMNISDFYLSMGYYRRCYLSLTASQKVLHDSVIFAEYPNTIESLFSLITL